MTEKVDNLIAKIPYKCEIDKPDVPWMRPQPKKVYCIDCQREVRVVECPGGLLVYRCNCKESDNEGC